VWIVATNIDPSGTPETGSFDAAMAAVSAARPELSKRFHIWGGSKILSLLTLYPDVAQYYAHYLTPGHVIAGLYHTIKSQFATMGDVIRDLCVTAFEDYAHTKLDQAGSEADNRPGIQRLYTDLPYSISEGSAENLIAVDLAKTAALNHSKSFATPSGEGWDRWAQEPSRSRVWFVKGGPGQGKSTSMQFMAQVHRAAIILGPDGPIVTFTQRQLAEEIRDRATQEDLWPLEPRLPVTVELREFAQWLGNRSEAQSKRMIVYLVARLTNSIGHQVSVGDFRASLGLARWFFVFDGLDEVPGDVKDEVAKEVSHFCNNTLIGELSDSMAVCTSRPQGYSGQFDTTTNTVLTLSRLSPGQALSCATPVLGIGRSKSEADSLVAILRDALNNAAVCEIMTTPLQAHIMAVVVRGGGKPPERRWQLFQNFYDIIKRREASRMLPNLRLSEVLTRRDKLIKALHARLGFELHSRAETSQGAVTSLSKAEFRILVDLVVREFQDREIDETVSVLMEATTERLVLVNTPDNGEFVRFDVRPLQEFFAAQYLYEAGDPRDLRDRLALLARDSHWREVMHFYLSALVENDRRTEIAVAVDVLSEVNWSAFSDDSRALAMRLGLGAMQAGRLLAEGVLEEDRRIRTSFRPVLEALGGCLDTSAILTELSPAHSRSWFIDLLFTIICERSEAETIGAIVLLFKLISSDDPRIDQLRIAFRTIPVEAKSVVIRLVSDGFLPWHERAAPDWMRGLALEYLSADYENSQIDDMWRLASLLISGASVRSGSTNETGWSDDLLLILPSLFVNYNLFDAENGTVLESESVFGFAELRVMESEILSLTASWSDATWEELSRKGGIFKGVYLTLNFHRSQNLVDFAKLQDWFGSNPQLANSLCNMMSGFIDAEKIRYGAEGRLTLDAWRNNWVGHWRQMIITPSVSDSVEWGLLAKKNPTVFWHSILFSPRAISDDLTSFLQDRAGIEALVALIDCGRVDSELWYTLNRLHALSALSPEVRSRILVRASMTLPDASGLEAEDKGVELSLPEEADFLPHVVQSVTTELFERMEHQYVRRKFAADEPSAAPILPATYFQLSEVRDGDFRTDVRISAAVLGALHSENTAERMVCLQKAAALVTAESPDWAKIALLTCLSSGIMAGDPESWRLAAGVLDESRNNYGLRLAVEPLVRRWRERTAAPVQNAPMMRWHSAPSAPA
jgi:hypothetical protein